MGGITTTLPKTQIARADNRETINPSTEEKQTTIIANQVKQSDVFGNVVIGQRENQVEINFFEDTAALNYNGLATETLSGGASITDNLGQILINSGSASTSSATLVSVKTIKYRAMHEIYNAFTATWDTFTASSTQLIGMFDVTNGFAIGYNGTSFSMLHRFNTSDTFITAFNEDLLDGTAGSKFTLNGNPVALDTTKINIYRIRYGWLGSAPVIFEVLSPDGDWVVFHIIIRANAYNVPVLTTPNVSLRAEVTKTSADSTSLVMRASSLVGGSTSEIEPLDSELTDNSLVKKVRAVLAAKMPNGDYGNIDATAGLNLKISVEEYDDAVNPIRKDMEGGGKITVGTSPVEVTFSGATKSVLIKSDINNSGTLYVGKSGVTSDGSNAIAPLEAGDDISIDYNDSDNALYVVASIASQNFWKGAAL